MHREPATVTVRYSNAMPGIVLSWADLLVAAATGAPEAVFQLIWRLDEKTPPGTGRGRAAAWDWDLLVESLEASYDSGEPFQPVVLAELMERARKAGEDQLPDEDQS
jgi:hypothetical protein